MEQEVEKDRTLASDVLNHFNLGLYSIQKEFSKAIQAYQKVIEMDPTYVEAYNNMGIIYQMLGNADRAFEAYQKATEINQGMRKGITILESSFYSKAVMKKRWRLSKKPWPSIPIILKAISTCGILYKKKGQWEKAIESYQKPLPSIRFTKKLITISHCFMNNWKTWSWPLAIINNLFSYPQNPIQN